MLKYLLLLCLFYCQLFLNIYSDEINTISCFKNGVIHTFVKTDPSTDHFVKNVFPGWEQETFAVFEKVRDPNGIAIDLGAWIGTTSIWLSNNFKHVIAVEADVISLKCLAQNLEASNCHNVTICNQPVDDQEREIIFGPIGGKLNESISTIKKVTNNPLDYTVMAITLKNLISQKLLANPEILYTPITFIKCDIEGGEEGIIIDLLNYAYENQCPVYLSFHYSWWSGTPIESFEPWFQLFKTNCPDKNVSSYIKRNPFESILFEPKE